MYKQHAEQTLKAPFYDTHNAQLLLEQNKLHNYKEVTISATAADGRNMRTVQSYQAMLEEDQHRDPFDLSRPVAQHLMIKPKAVHAILKSYSRLRLAHENSPS